MSGHSRCLQVLPDDRHGNLVICRDHNRSEDTWFGIGTMTSFLPSEAKTGSKEHSFQDFPVHRHYSWHYQIPTVIECLSMAIQEGLLQFSDTNS